MTVFGVGGAFLAADDPATMAQWYQDAFDLHFKDFGDGTFAHVFGGEGPPMGQTLFGFMQARDPVPRMAKTAPDDAPYGDQPCMMNLKTDNLAALTKHLTDFGAQVQPGPEMEGIGRFAWVLDPEDNRVEIWEPAN